MCGVYAGSVLLVALCCRVLLGVAVAMCFSDKRCIFMSRIDYDCTLVFVLMMGGQECGKFLCLYI